MNYSGKILINTRNITPINEILKSKKPPNEHELDTLLSFLSIYALSDGLLFDGTIPEKFLTPAIEIFEKWGIKKKVSPLKEYFGDDFDSLISDGLHVCHDEIIEAMDLNASYKPIKSIDSNAFFNVIKEIKSEQHQVNKRSIAYEAYYRGIMGGKLLIALTHPNNEIILKRVTQITTDQTTKSKLTSALIGTYRTFLLSNWSSKNNALFSTSPNFVNLLERRNEKSWDILIKHFNAPEFICNSNHKEKAEDKWKFPLVGAALLIDAASSNAQIKPTELLSFTNESETLIQLRALQKELIKRYTNASNVEEIKEQINSLWIKLCSKQNSPQTSLDDVLRNGIAYSIAPVLFATSAGSIAEKYFDFNALPETVIGSSITSLYMMYDYYTKKRNYLNAISNLSSYSDEVKSMVSSSVIKLWSRN